MYGEYIPKIMTVLAIKNLNNADKYYCFMNITIWYVNSVSSGDRWKIFKVLLTISFAKNDRDAFWSFIFI